MGTIGAQLMVVECVTTFTSLIWVKFILSLAQGHIKALERLDEMTNEYNYDVFNLGSGTGYSVFEVIKCFENALGHTLPF